MVIGRESAGGSSQVEHTGGEGEPDVVEGNEVAEPGGGAGVAETPQPGAEFRKGRCRAHVN